MTLLRQSRVLFVIACVALTTIYLTWWTAYATVHQSERFVPLPAGRPLERPELTLRVLSLAQAAQLTASDGGEPARPEPGTVWVVATMEVVRHVEDDLPVCNPTLVDTDQRQWSTKPPSTTRALQCDSDDVVIGQPYRYEAIYSVPSRLSSAVAGVALVDSTTVRRTPLLSPPS